MSHVFVILILLLLAVCGCVFCLDAWDYVLCGWLDLAASAVSNSNDGIYFSVLSIMLHVVSYIFFCLPFCFRSLLSCSRSFFSLFCCSINSFHNTRYTPQPHWVVLPCSLSLPMPSMLILILMPPPPSPLLLPLWLTLFLSLSIDQPKWQKVSQQATIKFVILPKHFFPLQVYCFCCYCPTLLSALLVRQKFPRNQDQHALGHFITRGMMLLLRQVSFLRVILLLVTTDVSLQLCLVRKSVSVINSLCHLILCMLTKS